MFSARQILPLAICALLPGCSETGPGAPEAEPIPPVARIEPFEVTKHGLRRTDPYHWLVEDREDPEVLAYLEAENEYAEAVMASTTDLQNRLIEEITGRVQETDLSVPDRRGDYFHYTKWEEGREHSMCVSWTNLPITPSSDSRISAAASCLKTRFLVRPWAGVRPGE
jgi:protease II